MASRSFKYQTFIMDDGRTVMAFDPNVYSFIEAYEIAKNDFGSENLTCTEMYVHNGFGNDSEGELRNGYWLTEEPVGKSFCVIVFMVKE